MGVLVSRNGVGSVTMQGTSGEPVLTYGALARLQAVVGAWQLAVLHVFTCNRDKMATINRHDYEDKNHHKDNQVDSSIDKNKTREVKKIDELDELS